MLNVLLFTMPSLHYYENFQRDTKDLKLKRAIICRTYSWFIAVKPRSTREKYRNRNTISRVLRGFTTIYLYHLNLYREFTT